MNTPVKEIEGTKESDSIFLNADLVSAYAEFAWPVVILIIFLGSFLIFRNEFRQFIGRVRKAKIAGSEIELDELQREISALSEGAETSEASGAIEVQDSQVAEKQGQSPRYAPVTTSVIDKLLFAIEQEPISAVILINNEIEKSLHERLIRKGIRIDRRVHTGLDRLLRHASKVLNLPLSFVDAVQRFAALRARATHETYLQNYDRDEVKKIAYIGIDILNYIRSIPNDKIFVGEINIPLYTDRNTDNKISDFVGVELIYAAQPGMTGHRIIAPVSPNLALSPGDQVTSEWGDTFDMAPVWVRGPQSEVAELAWSKPQILFEGKPIRDVDA